MEVIYSWYLQLEHDQSVRVREQPPYFKALKVYLPSPRFIPLLNYSEEIFDFSKNTLTSKQIKELKTNLLNDFKLIFDLCYYISK